MLPFSFSSLPFPSPNFLKTNKIDIKRKKQRPIEKSRVILPGQVFLHAQEVQQNPHKLVPEWPTHLSWHEPLGCQSSSLSSSECSRLAQRHRRSLAYTAGMREAVGDAHLSSQLPQQAVFSRLPSMFLPPPPRRGQGSATPLARAVLQCWDKHH